ncbi:MAG: phenylacetate--CoA ligase [Deltaproteobacteria bacterium]|nr:phenylacetate--CoA ligase [Deltaproteobacteria bacterium]MBW2069895.1 phenylacetate--CoA ligase [Deltaproteobacteria bacterium]
MNIWDREYECMPREELAQLQLERLQATLNRVYKNVAFYRKKFKEIGFEPEELIDLNDLQELPFTWSKDVSDAYPYDLFAVPLREVVRVHSSSGATDKPVVVGYTRQDLHHWSELVARILTAAGVTADDVVQITLNYGLVTGGLGIHNGAELIGASVLPTSVGRTERQIQIMKDYRTTVLVATPSYALVIASRMEEMGIDAKTINLRYALLAGEPWSEEMRMEIEERLFVKATDNYGLSEIMGPGVAGECLCQRGMHLNEDHFIAEIVDPQTGQRLSAGQEGELVLTTLTKEAFPLIRFRTRDLCSIITEPCDCGRTTVRLSRVRGRCDEVLIIKGVNIIPDRIGDILEEIQGKRPLYQLLVEREHNLDRLTILVEVSEDMFFDKMREQRALVEKMKGKIAGGIGVTPRIVLVEPSTIKRDEETGPGVIDRRPCCHIHQP